jgi:TonB family protein
VRRLGAIAALAVLFAVGRQAVAVEGDSYATALHDAIKANWHVPKGVPAQELARLVTQVLVRIQSDGKLDKPVLRQASGNEAFDQSCLRAVEKTGKVPPPSPKLAKMFQRGVIIEFEGKALAEPPAP